MDALLRDLLTYSQTGYADKDLAVNAKADLNLAMAKAVSSVESRIAETTERSPGTRYPWFGGMKIDWLRCFRTFSQMP